MVQLNSTKNKSSNGLGKYIFSSLALYFNNIHNARLVLQGKTAVAFFSPQKQKYFFRRKTNKTQTKTHHHPPSISCFIHIHYLVTVEQSLEASHKCTVHTLRHYLAPWQWGETEILLMFCSSNIISYAILLTVEEVLKLLSLHNIYTLISEEHVSYKEKWGPSEEIQSREKGKTCSFVGTERQQCKLCYIKSGATSNCPMLSQAEAGTTSSAVLCIWTLCSYLNHLSGVSLLPEGWLVCLFNMVNPY